MAKDTFFPRNLSSTAHCNLNDTTENTTYADKNEENQGAARPHIAVKKKIVEKDGKRRTTIGGTHKQTRTHKQ